jgi:hypothetical protein
MHKFSPAELIIQRSTDNLLPFLLSQKNGIQEVIANVSCHSTYLLFPYIYMCIFGTRQLDGDP